MSLTNLLYNSYKSKSVELTPKQLKNLMSKIDVVGSCWEWTASKTWNGYGQFNFNGKTILVHRLSYELFKGEIPQGMELDHLCRNRSCVNPDHLEAVTNKENQRRGNSGKNPNSWKFQKNKTHCPQGHEYSEENTNVDKINRRFCKQCNRIRSRNLQRKYRLILNAREFQHG
jgi:hypothetical protein